MLKRVFGAFLAAALALAPAAAQAQLTLTGAGKGSAAQGAGGGGGSSFTKFNSADKEADVTLSSADLVASIVTNTAAAGTHGVRSVDGIGSVKCHVEFTVSSNNGYPSGGHWFGLANSTFALNVTPQTSANAAALFGNEGFLYYNSAATSAGGSPTAGTVFALEADPTAENFQIKYTSGGAASSTRSYAGITGTVYIYAGAFRATADGLTISITMNAGQSAWSVTPTAGYEAACGTH